MTTRDEPPDRLEQLRARHAEHLQAAAGFETRPRLRDRNRFFNVLLSGDLDVHERTRLLWRKHRENARKADRISAEIDAVARQRAEGEAGYRALVAKAGQERSVKRSCKRMLASIRAARRRINRVRPSTEGSRSTADRDAREVSKRLSAVRRHADDLTGKLEGHRSFESGQLARLDIDFRGSTDHNERSKQYKDVKAVLGSLDKTVRSLLREATAREKTVKAKQRQYLKDGQARYRRESG